VSDIEDLPGRIEACFIGALAGEAAAGTAAGAADLLGVAESAAASGGFDEADLRHRGLERPSRGGSAGLVLRALPFGLLSPLDRPRLRRDAYRCVSLAGADEGTAVASVAAAILIADLLRFDVHTSLLRVRQSLLEDAPMALLQRLAVVDRDALPDDGADYEAAPGGDADAGLTLQRAVSAVAAAETLGGVLEAASGGPSVAVGLAGALAGAKGGAAMVAAADREHLPHAERAVAIARRLAERAASIPASAF